MQVVRLLAGWPAVPVGRGLRFARHQPQSGVAHRSTAPVRGIIRSSLRDFRRSTEPRSYGSVTSPHPLDSPELIRLVPRRTSYRRLRSSLDCPGRPPRSGRRAVVAGRPRRAQGQAGGVPNPSARPRPLRRGADQRGRVLPALEVEDEAHSRCGDPYCKGLTCWLFRSLSPPRPSVSCCERPTHFA